MTGTVLGCSTWVVTAAGGKPWKPPCGARPQPATSAAAANATARSRLGVPATDSGAAAPERECCACGQNGEGGGRDMMGSEIGRNIGRQRSGWLDNAVDITYIRECLQPCRQQRL